MTVRPPQRNSHRDRIESVLRGNFYVRDAVARWCDERAETARLVAECHKKCVDPKRSVRVTQQEYTAFAVGRVVFAAGQIAVTGVPPFETRGREAERVRGVIEAVCTQLVDECDQSPQQWHQGTRDLVASRT